MVSIGDESFKKEVFQSHSEIIELLNSAHHASQKNAIDPMEKAITEAMETNNKSTTVPLDLIKEYPLSKALLAMTRLMDAGTRAQMGRAARAFAVANRVDEPFTAVLDSETLRRRLRKEKKADESRARPIIIDKFSHVGGAAGMAPKTLRAANELSEFEEGGLVDDLIPGAAE